MSSHPYQEDLARLSGEYSRLLREHGDVPAAFQWSDVATQEERLRILAEVADLRRAKVLDFGCGTGHLLQVLRRRCRFAGEYVGYDLSPEMVAKGLAKFPEARFEVRDVLADGIPEDFDFVLVSGTFNNRVSDNWALMTALLHILYAHTRVALAFNLISAYVEYRDEGLWYVSPESAFRFCKEHLSPCVTLRHDYLLKPGVIPYEFSIYVRRTDVKIVRQSVAAE